MVTQLLSLSLQRRMDMCRTAGFLTSMLWAA